MDPLLETLEGAVQRLRQPPSVAAEVDKIREQLAEHRAQGLELDKLLPSFSALCARGEELIGRAAHDDPAAQGEWCCDVSDSEWQPHDIQSDTQADRPHSSCVKQSEGA